MNLKRKATIILILSLLMMALPLGSAMAAGSRNINCDQIQIQREWDLNGTSLGKYVDYLRSLKSMSPGDLRAMLGKFMCGKPAPTAAPTKAPTPAPTAAPTAAPTKAPTAAPTAAPTKAPTPAPTAAPTAAPTKAPTAAPTKAPTPAPTGNMSALEQQMISLVNKDRAANGLPALRFDAGLRAGALKHSQDMSANNYFSHTSPTYGSFSARIKASGVSYRTAGENIALYNNVEKAQAALMNSEGHRANILNPSFTRIGIGIVWNESKGAYYITQWFAA
jgi:uncharacterized YkwD family protein